MTPTPPQLPSMPSWVGVYGDVTPLKTLPKGRSLQQAWCQRSSLARGSGPASDPTAWPVLKKPPLPIQVGAPLPVVSPPPSRVASGEARLSRKVFFKLSPSVTAADTADLSVFDFLLHILRANLVAWTLSERFIPLPACLKSFLHKFNHFCQTL